MSKINQLAGKVGTYRRFYGDHDVRTQIAIEALASAQLTTALIDIAEKLRLSRMLTAGGYERLRHIAHQVIENELHGSDNDVP